LFRVDLAAVLRRRGGELRAKQAVKAEDFSREIVDDQLHGAAGVTGAELGGAGVVTR